MYFNMNIYTEYNVRIFSSLSLTFDASRNTRLQIQFELLYLSIFSNINTVIKCSYFVEKQLKAKKLMTNFIACSVLKNSNICPWQMGERCKKICLDWI